MGKRKSRFIRIPIVERNLLRLKTAYDWCIAKLVILFLHYAKKLPAAKSSEYAERAGRFLAPLLPRTKLARQNIALAFPEKSAKEVDALARAAWGHVARTFAEYVFLDQLFDFDVNTPDKGNIEVHGIENFIKCRESNKPVIIFTAHTGNWEILPIAASSYGLNVTALFRPPNNPFLAKRLLKARHTDNGHLVPSRAGASWALIDVLENKGTIGLLTDQAFTRGPHITFLGRKATANPLAAKLARQFDCDIHPARCIRLPNGRFRLELHNALTLPKNEDGSLNIVQTTQSINRVIESWIQEYPEQWFWLHDRWKIKTDQRKKWSQ